MENTDSSIPVKPGNPEVAQPKLPQNRGKSALPKSIQRRYKAFVKEYIDSGFNATEAYSRVYKLKDRDSAKQCGYRLLTNVYVASLLEAELVKLNVDSLVSKPVIVADIENLLPSLKSEQAKCRLLELKAKIGHLYDDNKPNLTQINVFSEQISAICAKRGIKDNNDKANASIDNTDIVDIQPMAK